MSQATSFFGGRAANPALAGQQQQQQQQHTGDQQQDSNNATAAVSAKEVEVLEMDEVNLHPCMELFLKTIAHIQQKFPPAGVVPGTSSSSSPADEMPKWMFELHSKFQRRDTHPNIQLFIVKIILNRSKIFQPYAHFWLRPLLEFVINNEVMQQQHQLRSGSGSGNSSGSGLNYMERDVAILLLKWNVAPRTTQSEVVALANAFLVSNSLSSSPMAHVLFSEPCDQV